MDAAGTFDDPPHQRTCLGSARSQVLKVSKPGESQARVRHVQLAAMTFEAVRDVFPLIPFQAVTQPLV